MVLVGVTAGSKAAVITSGYTAATSQPTRASRTSHVALAWATNAPFPLLPLGLILGDLDACFTIEF